MHTSSTVIDLAATLVKITHLDDACLGRALDKAATRLMVHPWRFVAGQLEITSASHPNEIHIATTHGCTCEARRFCWHMAGLRILNVVAATGVEVVPALPLPNMQLMEDYEAYADYGSFLDEPIIWSVSE